MAERAHRIVARYDEAADEHAVDEETSAARRREEREARLRRAVPVSEWMQKQRERIVAKDLAPMVQRMYAGSFVMSERWRQEYIDFWNLDPDFNW
jgi:hypothetical protein